jgi:hypothetical protein
MRCRCSDPTPTALSSMATRWISCKPNPALLIYAMPHDTPLFWKLDSSLPPPPSDNRATTGAGPTAQCQGPLHPENPACHTDGDCHDVVRACTTHRQLVVYTTSILAYRQRYK